MDMHKIESEVLNILSVFTQKESEENWTSMDDSLAKFNALVPEAAELQGFIPSVKRLKQPITQSVYHIFQ
jgi:hypothetical protein